VKHAKPPASRKDSSEWYVVAQGFKGGEGRAERQLNLSNAKQR
jgi:23S rRNA (uridine2552-2'-O)-methyltransferase